MIIAKIKVSGSHRGFRNKTDLLTPLYNVGEVLNLGFDMQDLFVQVTVVIHAKSTQSSPDPRVQNTRRRLNPSAYGA
jgi:hypothetical protein